MRKTIMIGSVECNFKTSAALPRMYRLKFQRDLFNDLNSIDRQIKAQEKHKEEMRQIALDKGIPFDESEYESTLPVNTLTTFENIAFLMHKHGDPTQPTEIDEWLDQFETFDIYNVFPEILGMWNDENKQFSTPKKENEE